MAFPLYSVKYIAIRTKSKPAAISDEIGAEKTQT